MAVLSALRLPRRAIVPEPINGQPPMFAEGGPLAAQQHAAISARRRRPRVGLLVARHLFVALVGFGFLVVAAYLWREWAGLLATGVAVLLAEVMVENAVKQALEPPEGGGGR